MSLARHCIAEDHEAPCADGRWTGLRVGQTHGRCGGSLAAVNDDLAGFQRGLHLDSVSIEPPRGLGTGSYDLGMADTARFLPRAREAKRESKTVEFKEQFDTDNDCDWRELMKDLVAIANVGGGVILVGVKNDGTISGTDIRSVLALDGATICDKLASYLGEDFDDFEIKAITRGGISVAAIVIGPAEEAPLTFCSPGRTLTRVGRAGRSRRLVEGRTSVMAQRASRVHEKTFDSSSTGGSKPSVEIGWEVSGA